LNDGGAIEDHWTFLSLPDRDGLDLGRRGGIEIGGGASCVEGQAKLTS
jgi:hypothetical protein